MEKPKKSEEIRSCISDLPDPLLCHILSYLTTKDSVRSSVLSQRWRRIWSQVPVLDLNSTQFDDDCDFVDFMNRFLESDENLDFKRFKLVCSFDGIEQFMCGDDDDDDDDNDDSLLQSWIDDVVGRGVRHLDVEIISDDNEFLCMPLSLYSCKTLVTLSLCHVILGYLKPESVVSLPCLKTMRLEMVRHSDRLILQMLIPSCPVLEELTIIRDPYDISDLTCVRSQSLKKLTLVIKRFEDKVIDDHAVEIDAPKLERMSLHDHLSKSFIIIHRVATSAVVNIDVNFDMEHDDDDDDDNDDDDDSERAMVRNFFTAISEVSGMKISYAAIEVLTHLVVDSITLQNDISLI